VVVAFLMIRFLGKVLVGRDSQAMTPQDEGGDDVPQYGEVA
jgi:hypothetical protein